MHVLSRGGATEFGCDCYTSCAAHGQASAGSKMSYVRSGIAIVICAGLGAAIAWIVVSSIGLGGIAGAIAAAVIGMVLATALFAGGVVLGKALGYFK